MSRSLIDSLARSRFSTPIPTWRWSARAYRKIDERGALLGDRTLPVDYDRIRWVLHFYCPFVHSAVVFRAAVVRAMGDYDEAFVYAQDYDLWSRLAVAHRVANLPDSLVRYRMGATTLTATIGDQSGEVVRIAARNIRVVRPPRAVGRHALGDGRTGSGRCVGAYADGLCHHARRRTRGTRSAVCVESADAR